MAQTDTGVVPLDVRLRRLLADRRMSGRELARRTDMSIATCSRVLRGDRDLTVTELHRVAAALEVPVGDLLADERQGSAA